MQDFRDLKVWRFQEVKRMLARLIARVRRDDGYKLTA
jgi:hypothetical protein